jgi:hypothetical protein
VAQKAWESCEFTAPTTGNYTFREHLFSSQAGWPGAFMGMAWSSRNLPNVCSAPAKTFPPTGGNVAFNTDNGPTYFDTYHGYRGGAILKNAAPSGTYYLIVDGRNGAVGADTVNLSFPP